MGFEDLGDKLDRVIDEMATKDDIARLDKRIDTVIDEMVTHEDLKQLEERLEKKIDERFGQVMTAIDALTKAVADLRLEYSVVAVQMKRYDEWFRILAKKVKVKLPS